MSSIDSDREARLRISSELGTNFLVEAGAGSGKTSCLVDRMVSLITSGTCLPHHLAAITFTVKSAQELRSRFQVRLEVEASTRGHESDAGRRLLAATENFNKAFIGTVHSFCASILRERPLEAGLAPDFTEVLGLDEQLLQKEAWQDFENSLTTGNEALLATLGELGLKFEDLETYFDKLCLYPDVDFAAAAVTAPAAATVRAKFFEMLDEVKPFLPDTLKAEDMDDLQKVIHEGLRYRNKETQHDAGQLRQLLEKFSTNNRITQKRWRSKKDATDAENRIQQFRGDFLDSYLSADNMVSYDKVLQILRPALTEYQRKRSRTHQLTMNDLLLHTATLLRQNAEVRGYFQSRYTHLLIDEFQDTDPIQAEIVFLLASADTQEENWASVRLRPGSLFLVGDPQQSIYRFRRADISLYYTVKELLRSAGGEVLVLNTNFRSLPSIIKGVHQAASAIFSASGPPYQAPYSELIPARKEGQKHEDISTLVVKKVESNKPAEIARLDAENIANLIAANLKAPLELTRTEGEKARGLTSEATPKDFLILTRHKKNLEHYATALLNRGIPCTAEHEPDTELSAGLKAFITLLRAVADFTDEVSLIAALRGPLLGHSDDEIWQLRKGKNYFPTSIPQSQDAGAKTPCRTSLELITKFRTYVDSMPLSSIIERIAREVGLLPLALSGSEKKKALAEVLDWVELARRYDGHLCLRDFVMQNKELRQAHAATGYDYDVPLSETVRIMNLHKAKGLEAPVVFLANPSRTKDQRIDFHIASIDLLAARHRQAKRRGYFRLRKPSPYNNSNITIAQSDNWTRYEQEERDYLAAEEQRLMYVAATRAKNILVISAYEKDKDACREGPWRDLLPKDCPTKDVTASEPQASAAPTPQQFSVAAISELQAGILDKRTKSKQPSYSANKVTVYTKQNKAPARHRTGKGASWGNAVHFCLEKLLKGEYVDYTHILRRCARELGEEEELRRLVDGVQAMPVWRRVMSAPVRLSEMPFGLAETTGYRLGVIDLVFRESDGWVVVDFKSDSIKDDEQLNALADYYQAQVQEYACRFTEITGQPVKERGLLFTDRLTYIKLP